MTHLRKETATYIQKEKQYTKQYINTEYKKNENKYTQQENKHKKNIKEPKSSN